MYAASSCFSANCTSPQVAESQGGEPLRSALAYLGEAASSLPAHTVRQALTHGC